MEKMFMHPATVLGRISNGWFDIQRSFGRPEIHKESFRFGSLRAVNDRLIEPGGKIGFLPLRDMDLVTVVLSGRIEHRDSLGNVATMNEGDVGILRAGRGINQIEYNKQNHRYAEVIQLWVDQVCECSEPQFLCIKRADSLPVNEVVKLCDSHMVNPASRHYGSLHRVRLTRESFATYHRESPDNGVYVISVSGEVLVNNYKLKRRDGLGIASLDEINLMAATDSDVLVAEVPFN